ncbi:MAG: hypothetical protein AAF770_00515 [Bacteroidota bacterium]
MAAYWAPHICQKSKILIDATYYESSVRFPTNQHFFWESVEFLYRIMKHMCKKAGFKRIRTKYNSWAAGYHVYSQKRRTPKKEKNLDKSVN